MNSVPGDGTDSKAKSDDGDRLKYVQAANEGMKLLLNSRLTESEELFSKSRYQTFHIGHK